MTYAGASSRAPVVCNAILALLLVEPIDAAVRAFDALEKDIESYGSTVKSEQDTRVKIIDRVLTEVLGWPLAEIMTEVQAGKGFVDYKLTNRGLARAVVEAKRDGREFGLESRTAGRAYRLDGPTFHSVDVREGIDQAIRYCGRKNAELACVTNGREWLVFRGSRLGDGKDTEEGVAFVFPTLGAIRSSFALFYDLLSYPAVGEFRYRAHFQEAEGRPIRAHEFKRTLRSSQSRSLLQQPPLMADLERIMTSFFRRLSGDDDPDLLAQCFVISRESQTADEKIARISEDLLGRIRSLNTGKAAELTELVERVKVTQRNEFVLLIGTKGAGKSTFIDRFFRFILPQSLAAECVIARVNLADSEGNEQSIASWLDRRLLEALEAAVFGEGGPSFDELQGMFFDEYRRRSQGTLKHLYERDKEEFKIDFGRFIETRREERPHEYITRIVHHIVLSRRRVPCLVFDNADHFTIEFQERVFQYARSVYESAVCLVIMPITDRTSWQLSREGALRSFENETLFLPTPLPLVVLKKRVAFIELRLADEKRQPGRGYFLNRGITLSLDNITAFTAALQTVFLRSGEVAFWIGNLANNDIRRSLEIAKQLVTSPHLGVVELLKAYVVGSSIALPPWRVKRALILGRYDIFPTGEHTFVRNVFALDEELDSSPLLGLRILQLLRDAQKAEVGDSRSEDPFIAVDQVVDYFRAMLVDPRVTLASLGHMLEDGLCLSYDPTVTEIANARKIELSPSGYQHLRWGARDQNYLSSMLEVTPIVDSLPFERLSELARRPRRDVWKERLEVFIEYLTRQDAQSCKIPSHSAFVSQSRLSAIMHRVTEEHHDVETPSEERTAPPAQGNPSGITTQG